MISPALTYTAFALAVCRVTASPLVAMDPVTVHFGTVRTVFINDRRLENVVSKFQRRLGRECALDSTTQDKEGVIWCKRAGEGYTDFFRQRPVVEPATLKKLKAATREELTGLLGQPVFMDGPLDRDGTVVWKWRICNGKNGKELRALEVAAGFKAGAITNAVFLLICDGQAK